MILALSIRSTIHNMYKNNLKNWKLMFILEEELHNNWDYVMSPGKTVQALSLTNTGSKNTHILLEKAYKHQARSTGLFE